MSSSTLGPLFEYYDIPVLVTLSVTAGFVTVAALWSRHVLAVFKTLISRLVNIVLLNSLPIKHLEHGIKLPSLPYVIPDGQGNVEKFLQGRKNNAKWEAEYGSLYCLWAGMKGEVVLTKAAHVRAVFHDSHSHSKAHANDSGYLMESLLGSCLGLINGHAWSAVKTVVEPPFLHRSMGAYGAEVQDFTRAYLRRLGEKKDFMHQGGNLHPVHDIKLLPFLFVARVIYGSMSDDLEGELRDLIPPREDLFKSVIGGGITKYAWSQLLPLPAIRKLRHFKACFAHWNDDAHAHALRIRADGDAPILGMYQAVKDGIITREQLLQTLDEMLFANIDVTMGGLSWTLVFLAANPAVQKALRTEVDEQCTSVATRSTYLLSTWTTTPNLLGACILESASLRPLAAFSVPQSCPTSRTLDGYEIPAGTNFVVDSYALNIRDPFWGDDREKFIPERWLEHHKSRRDLRYRYWRFGFGPRTCVGKYLADLILRSVVVEILENWHISLEGAAGKGYSRKNDGDSEEEMNWPWDDEMWIHHPNMLLKCDLLATSPDAVYKVIP